MPFTAADFETKPTGSFTAADFETPTAGGGSFTAADFETPDLNIFQRGASAVTDTLQREFAPPRPPIEDPSPFGDISQGPNLREKFAPLADPNVIFPHTTQGQLGEAPIGNLLAPVTSLLAESAGRDFFSGKRGGKIKGIAKAFQLPTTALIDTAGTGLKIFGDVITGVFNKVGGATIRAIKPGKRNKDSFLPFGEDVLQSFTKGDRGHGEIIQRDLVPQLNARFEKVVAEGMDPKKAAGQMQRELSIRGALPDMAEEIVLAALFFRKFLNKKLFGKEERLAAIQSTRAELRAIAATENLEAQAGKVPLLEGPGARVPGAAAPSVAAKEPIVGERFVGGEGGFKRQIQGPQVENIIEKGGRAAPQVARPVSEGERLGRSLQGERFVDIDVAGGVSKAAPLSREARLAQAAQGARGAAAQEAGDLQRAKIASEKAFPQTGQKALPPAAEGARPPVADAKPIIAGRKFTLEQPGAIAKTQVEKQGAPRAFGLGGKEPSVAARRRITAAAEEDKKLNILEKSASQKKAPSKLDKEKAQVVEDVRASQAAKEAALKASKKKVVKKTKSVVDVKVKRTKKDQVKDVGKVLKGVKSKGLGSNLGNVGLDAEGSAAARRLAQDAKNAGKDFGRYLREELKMTDAKADELVKLVASGKIRQAGATAQENAQLAALRETAASPDKSAAIDATRQVKDLQRTIAKRKGQAGFARTGGPKKTSEAEKVARVARQQAKLDALKAKKAGKVLPENATIGDVVDGKVAGPVTFQRRNKKGKVVSDEELIGKIEVVLPETVEVIGKDGRKLTKEVGGTVVGNTKVGEMVKSGEMSERNAKVMIVADKVNPIIGSKFAETTLAERRAAIGNPSINEVLKVVERVDPRELSALHDTPVAQALATAKRAQDQGVPIVQVMDEIAQDLLVARKVANILGVNLQAIRRSAARGELRQILEAQLKSKETNKFDKIKLREALKDLGSPLARTRFIRTMDMVTKYGINAMLSSPVTFMRNLIGSAIGVGSQIPTKIAQATVSNIFAALSKVKTTIGLKPIKQTERVFFREVGPELVGIIRGFFGRGLRKGARFLKHEEISKVFSEIERKVERVAAVHIPKGQSFSTLKRNKKAALLKQLRRDLTDLLTEEEVTRAAELGFSAARESTNLLDKIINIPVRGLVATDKVFQTASATGHIAARRVREAIRTGRPVRDIHLSPEQIEGAKVDAMFQVFRQRLGPLFGSIQNIISETPIMPLMIPFLKSRINFVKFGLKHSPLGAIDTVRTSIAAGAIDTKSAARVLSGSAAIFGLDKFFEANSDTMQVHPSAGSQAERALLRESGIGEQVIVFGTDLNDPAKRKITHTEPYANLAPWSGPMEVVGLKQEYYRRLKRGDRIDEAFGKTFNKALKGVLNQSAFGSVKDAVRAGENIADTSVAINADGTPEHSTIMSMLRGPAGKVLSRKFAGVAVPNIIRDIRKLLDPRIFDAKGFGDELLISLPPIFGKDPAKGIPVRQTIFGTDAKRTQRRLPFNPFTKNPNIDRTIEKMINLEIFPGKAPKKLSHKGIPIVLTEQEQQQFNFLGDILKTVLDDVIAMDVFDDIPELGQKMIIEDVLDRFRKKQLKAVKGEGIIRLIQSDEGIQQMIQGVTKGFSPF